MSIVASSLGNITCLLATALPPFADMEDDSVPNPSLNLYIDLAPQTTFYGFKDGREIVPGIQSIELMVNAEKYGYGKNLQQGSVTGEICEGGSSTGNFDNAYVLSINPLNLIQSGSEGEGLISFLEADRLSSGSILTTNSGVPVDDLYIEVRDLAEQVPKISGLIKRTGTVVHSMEILYDNDSKFRKKKDTSTIKALIFPKTDNALKIIISNLQADENVVDVYVD